MKILKKNYLNNTQKAFIHAILKERDSMYHYLNKKDIESKFVNIRFEFDPFRHELEYKMFLRKNYFPVQEN